PNQLTLLFLCKLAIDASNVTLATSAACNAKLTPCTTFRRVSESLHRPQPPPLSDSPSSFSVCFLLLHTHRTNALIPKQGMRRGIKRKIIMPSKSFALAERQQIIVRPLHLQHSEHAHSQHQTHADSSSSSGESELTAASW